MSNSFCVEKLSLLVFMLKLAAILTQRVTAVDQTLSRADFYIWLYDKTCEDTEKMTEINFLSHKFKKSLLSHVFLIFKSYLYNLS